MNQNERLEVSLVKPFRWGASLNEILALDGFGDGPDCVDPEDWLVFTSSVAQECGIEPGQTVLELGCGAGAFLKGLQIAVNSLRIFGVDYSPGLLETARLAIPEGTFTEADLRSLELGKDFDFIIAHSVFQYLDFAAAERVLLSSLARARRAFAILDIYRADVRHQTEAIRRFAAHDKRNDESYQNLSHSYYDFDFFSKFEGDGWTLRETTARISRYRFRDLRFSVVFSKNSS